MYNRAIKKVFTSVTFDSFIVITLSSPTLIVKRKGSFYRRSIIVSIVECNGFIVNKKMWNFLVVTIRKREK